MPAAESSEKQLQISDTTGGPYRARKSRFNDSWNIERQYPCINGLTAWFQVAVVHQADDAEIGYTDGAFGSAQDRAENIVAALNRGIS